MTSNGFVANTSTTVLLNAKHRRIGVPSQVLSKRRNLNHYYQSQVEAPKVNIFLTLEGVSRLCEYEPTYYMRWSTDKQRQIPQKYNLAHKTQSLQSKLKFWNLEIKLVLAWSSHIHSHKEMLKIKIKCLLPSLFRFYKNCQFFQCAQFVVYFCLRLLDFTKIRTRFCKV